MLGAARAAARLLAGQDAVGRAAARRLSTAAKLEGVAGAGPAPGAPTAPLVGRSSSARGARRLAACSAAGALGGLGLAAACSDDPRQTAGIAGAVAVRTTRDVVFSAILMADYGWSLLGLEGEERASAMAACHRRGAARLLRLCEANGGVYVKLGQHLGMLDHIIPEAYVRIMRDTLLDACPVSPFESVREVLRADLGLGDLGEVFASIDPEPLASASLAQVHRARLVTGEEVAVKVQHPGLREALAADMAAVQAAVSVAKLVFPDFDYQWLVDETKESMPYELDFLHEISNLERCARDLNVALDAGFGAGLGRAGRGSAGAEGAGGPGPLGAGPPPHHPAGPAPRVTVPTPCRALSSSRVLTMEFVEGVGATDLDGLASLAVPPAHVARLVRQTFDRMAFTSGFVHCDPHPANIKVRRIGPGRDDWQVVLLDHGLYRELPDDLRVGYAHLWHGLVLGDGDEVMRGVRKLGIDEEKAALFIAILTRAAWEEVVRGGPPGARATASWGDGPRGGPAEVSARPASAATAGVGGAGPEADRVSGVSRSSDATPSFSFDPESRLNMPEAEQAARAEHVAKFAANNVREITDLLAILPRQVLLLMKTNDCLRAVDRELGQPAGTLTATARAAARAIEQQAIEEQGGGLAARARAAVDRLRLETRLLGFRALVAAIRLRNRWRHAEDGR